ncbi:MAG: hypothetical protein ACKVHE_08545 [Planctomycetales bacterium]|jgi:hypothetical protein
MTNFDRSIEFSIRPYVSVGPVAFEMNRIEVHEVLGNPDRTHRQDASVVCLDVWEDHGLTIAFKNPTRLSQFEFWHGRADLSVCGEPLQTTADFTDSISTLLSLDDSPVDYLGYLIFLQLGVFTRYLNAEFKGRSLSVFQRGAWDKYLGDATAPDLFRYNS